MAQTHDDDQMHFIKIESGNNARCTLSLDCISFNHDYKQFSFDVICAYIVDSVILSVNLSVENGHADVDIVVDLCHLSDPVPLSLPEVIVLVKTLEARIQDRVHKVSLARPGKSFRRLWKVCKPLINRDTRSKIVFPEACAHR